MPADARTVNWPSLNSQFTPKPQNNSDHSLMTIIAKYGVLISKWGGLYYVLLEVSRNKIAFCKNVHVDDWTDELVIIASNGVMGKRHSQYRVKKVKIYVYWPHLQTILIYFNYFTPKYSDLEEALNNGK